MKWPDAPARVDRAALLAQIAERNHHLAEEGDRDRRRDAALTALRCLLWLAAGLFCFAWAFHTTDPVYGRAAFYAGLGVGNGGIVFSLLGWYRRGEQRGDW